MTKDRTITTTTGRTVDPDGDGEMIALELKAEGVHYVLGWDEHDDRFRLYRGLGPERRIAYAEVLRVDRTSDVGDNAAAFAYLGQVVGAMIARGDVDPVAGFRMDANGIGTTYVLMWDARRYGPGAWVVDVASGPAVQTVYGRSVESHDAFGTRAMSDERAMAIGFHQAVAFVAERVIAEVYGETHG